MAVRKRRPNRTYGLDNALQEIAPRSINSQRAPTSADLAEIGQQWVDEPNDAVYVLTSITANSANWATSPASGSETLSSLVVTGTTNLQGAVTLDDTLDVTGATTLADATVTGTLSFTGNLDLTSTALIDIISTLNAAPSILIEADGGISEQVQIHSDQGTSTSSILLLSDVGGVTLTATGSTATNAIDINANSGGVDIDGALQVNISSSQVASDAILINSSAGGIELDAAGALTISNSTVDSLTITAVGGGDLLLSSLADILIGSNGGSTQISGAVDAADAVLLEVNAGISETIRIHTVQGTGANSINLQSDAGGITLTSNLATADGINLNAIAGGVDIDAALQVNIASSQDATDAIVLSSSAGGINISATGEAGQDIDITNTGGSVNIISTENDANAIFIQASGGVSERITLNSDQGTSASSIFLLSDVGGITLQALGNATNDAINIEAINGGIDIDATLQINIETLEATANAIRIQSLAGGIDIDASLNISLNTTLTDADALELISSGGVDIVATGGAATDIDISSLLGSVNISAGESVADAIVINASDASGGIDILTGGGEVSISSSGNVSMTPATATEASPTATTTINARVFKATFTGFTTAAAASQAFTITNSALGAGDGVMLTVANRGSNDAQMTLNRVNTQTAGTIIVDTTNNGAAALNGDVIITGWIID